MKLERWLNTVGDDAPHVMRPLLALLQCLIDEAWEDGCARGSRSMKEDALMVARKHGAKKKIIAALEEEL